MPPATHTKPAPERSSRVPKMNDSVFYTSENGVVSPALVTFVYENDEGVDLTVFTRSGPRVVTRVKEAEGEENLAWRWPPRA